MNNRETKQITLNKSGLVVTYKAFINAQERRDWLRVAMNESDSKVNSRFELEDFVFNLLTVSIGQDKEGFVPIIMNLHQDDYKQIDKAYSEVILGEDFLEKKEN